MLPYVHRAPYYRHIPAEVLAQQGIEFWAPDVPEGGLASNGWYEPEARTISLRHPFVAPPPDHRPAR